MKVRLFRESSHSFSARRIAQAVGSTQTAHDRTVFVQYLRVSAGQTEHLDLTRTRNGVAVTDCHRSGVLETLGQVATSHLAEAREGDHLPFENAVPLHVVTAQRTVHHDLLEFHPVVRQTKIDPLHAALDANRIAGISDEAGDQHIVSLNPVYGIISFGIGTGSHRRSGPVHRCTDQRLVRVGSIYDTFDILSPSRAECRPNMLGGLALGFIWQFIFQVVFTDILFGPGGVLHIEGLRFMTQSPVKALFALLIMTTWQNAGYMMIIYVGGLNTISGDLYEAASLDGANAFQRFRKITLPLLMPSVTVVLFLTLSNSFKLLDQNVALTDGEFGTRMLALQILRTLKDTSPPDYGAAQAQAVIFFVVVAVISLIQVYVTGKKEVEM